MKTTKPDVFVVDALSNDVEDLESLLRMLNSDTQIGWVQEWGRAFTKLDVIGALMRLIRNGAVQAYVVDTDRKGLVPLQDSALPIAMENAWFGLTGRGRVLHANWAGREDA